MERYLIKDFPKDRITCVIYCLDLLLENNGTAAITNLKMNWYNIFDNMFNQVQNKYEDKGVKFATERGGTGYIGEVVLAVYPSKGLIEKLENNKQVKKLFVLEWNESDCREWIDKFKPEIIELEERL